MYLNPTLGVAQTAIVSCCMYDCVRMRSMWSLEIRKASVHRSCGSISVRKPLCAWCVYAYLLELSTFRSSIKSMHYSFLFRVLRRRLTLQYRAGGVAAPGGCRLPSSAGTRKTRGPCAPSRGRLAAWGPPRRVQPVPDRFRPLPGSSIQATFVARLGRCFRLTDCGSARCAR